MTPTGSITTGEVWPFARPLKWIHDPIVQGLLATLVVSAIFLGFPAIDLWVSDLFYRPGAGFPLAGMDAFRALRNLGSSLLIVVVLAMAVTVGMKLAFPANRTLIEPRRMLVSVLTLALAPGVLVNAIFKSYWGRPRPVSTEAFGGEHPFVGVWEITDYCARNCSFVSGEASSALWLLTLVLLLPAAWRARAVPVILVIAVLLSFNRIAFGGHFLSDVVLSWTMTLTVMVLVHRGLYALAPANPADDPLERGLTRTGTALRGVFKWLK